MSTPRARTRPRPSRGPQVRPPGPLLPLVRRVGSQPPTRRAVAAAALVLAAGGGCGRVATEAVDDAMAPAPVVAGSIPADGSSDGTAAPVPGTSVPGPPSIDLDAAVEAGAPMPEIVTDPQVAVAVGHDNEIIGVHNFTHKPLGYRHIPIWPCHYFAMKGASGSTFGLGIDAVRGTITPSPGEWVLLSCTDGRFVRREETFTFDPDRPLGSWEER